MTLSLPGLRKISLKKKLSCKVRKTSRSIRVHLEYSQVKAAKLCSSLRYKLLYGVNIHDSGILVRPAVQTAMAQLWPAPRNIAHLPKAWRCHLRFSCCMGSVCRLPQHTQWHRICALKFRYWLLHCPNKFRKKYICLKSRLYCPVFIYEMQLCVD